MSESEALNDAPAKRSGKKPLFVGLVCALVGAGAGYFALSSGLVLGKAEEPAGTEHASTHDDGHSASESHAEAAQPAQHGNMSYVEVTPVVVSLPSGSRHSHFRLTIQLEVASSSASDVEHMMPRITDTMNTYLRALTPEDFEDQAALARIRAHLLARISTALNTNQIHDLLVMEFLLS